MTTSAFPYFPVVPSRPICKIACDREWECDLTLNDYDMWIVASGIGRLMIDDAMFEVKAAQSFIFAPGQRVIGSHDPNDPFEVWCFHFSVAPRHAPLVKKLTKACQGLSLSGMQTLEPLLEGFRHQEGFGDKLAAEQTLHFSWLIFSVLWRQAHLPRQGPTDARLDSLIHRITTQPGQDWPLRKMTSETALSCTRLNARFHELTGTSPLQFVIKARIRHASNLLRETTLPVGEIADICGYRDVYFFSRQFKERQGASPSVYRKSHSKRLNTPQHH